MTKAKELMAIVSKSVVKLFNVRHEVKPLLHMVDEHGNHIPFHFAGGFAPGEKDNTAQIMRQTLIAANAQRYAFVTEAWVVDGTARADVDEALAMTRRGESLEHHIDRKEVITILVEDKNTKEKLSRMYRILRPEHGPPTLSPPRDLELAEGEHSGRFDNMFEPL